MPSEKLPMPCGALRLPARARRSGGAGCGGRSASSRRTPAGSTTLASRGKVDSPLTDIHNHLGCLRDDHLAVRWSARRSSRSAPRRRARRSCSRPRRERRRRTQIDGSAQGAEVIGPALLYPNQGSPAELTRSRTASDRACRDRRPTRMPRDAGARCAGPCTRLPLPCVTWRARHQPDLPGPLVSFPPLS